MDLRYMTKAETKSDKEYFIERANEIREEAKDDFSIQFKLVGSSKRNMVLRNKDNQNDHFDYDYQLWIDKNKNNKSCKEIKEYFLDLFRKHFPKPEWKVEDSTSAITIKNQDEDKEEDYSYDVAIIETNKTTSKPNILKHYKENNEHTYTWEEIPDYKDHRENLKKIKGHESWSKLRDKYKDKKENNKDNTESYLLFIEAAHDVAQTINT